MRCLAGLVLLIAWSACGDSADETADAGLATDGGARVDASSEAEGGSTVGGRSDAGGGVDAGTDASVPPAGDGGVSPPSTLGQSCAAASDCDDGLFCNGEETCDGDDKCAAGTPPALDDALACTTDRCDEVLGRVLHDPDHGACDDDDPCTEDVCTTVGCTHGHDFDACPCDPTGACDPFDAAPCDTGEACRVTGTGTECHTIDLPELSVGEGCPLFADTERCEAGTMCLDFGQGLSCHRMCPAGSIGACGGGAACLTGVVGDECIGICRPLPEPCDVLVQDCDAGDTCAIASNPETGARYTGCRPTGPRAVTQSCGGGNGNCMFGLVCLSNLCRQVCDPEGGEPSCTIPGHECTARSATYDLWYCE